MNMVNRSFKEKFLEEIKNNYSTPGSNRSYEQYKILFNNDALELHEDRIFGKDLYNFTTDEIKELLRFMHVSSESTLATYLTMIKKYLLFAQQHKVSIQNVNSALSISREDIRELVYTKGEYEKYPTYREYKEGVLKKDKSGNDIIKNYQEKLLYVLIYNGIFGKDYSDIAGLKQSQFKYFEKEIYLTDGEIIKLEDWETDIIQEAIKEDSYEGYTYDRSMDYYATDYIVKLIQRFKFGKEDDYEPSESEYKEADKQVIMKRLRNCNKLIGQPFWKAKTIHDAGMCRRMLQIKENWRLKEVEEYTKANDVSINPSNCIRIIEILKDKQHMEILSKPNMEMSQPI